MLVTNADSLGTTAPRRLALSLVEAGLAAVETTTVIKQQVTWSDNRLGVGADHFTLSPAGRLLVVAIGKCALAAATALETIIGDRINAGVVIDVKAESTPPLRRLKSFRGDHPFPTARNVTATQEIIKLLEGVTADDLVLVVVSGGGSTLLCQPYNFTCQQESELVRALFKAGATIQELNTVRKHLSLARGGYLAKYAYPAQVVGLVFSDVPGDDLSFIASGPTVLDQTRTADAVDIAERYHLTEQTGFQLTQLLETPKETKYFDRVKNYLMVSNSVALTTMRAAAAAAGLQPVIKTNQLTGEARVVAEQVITELHQAPSGTVWLYGGETTVTIGGGGQGGRNQELALAALTVLRDNELVLTLASDGHDNSSAAGAISDDTTKQKAAAKKITPEQFLATNDSFHFFEQTGDQLQTGPTGINIADLLIALKQ